MNQRGFSIGQIVVSLGALAMLSLVFAQIMANNAKQAKQMAQKSEVLELSNDLNRAFKSFPSSCACIFQTGIQPQSGGSNVSALLTSTSDIPLNLANLNVSFFADGAASCAAAAKSNIITAGKPMGKNGLSVKSASLSAPINMSGKYVTNLTLSVQPEDPNAVQLKPIVIQQIILNASGGTFTCFKSTDNLANVGCPTGQTMSGFDASGNPVCRTPASVANTSCPSGTTLRGYDANSLPVCVTSTTTSPLANIGCASGQTLRGFTSTGSPICDVLPAPQPPQQTGGTGAAVQCPSGQVLRGIDASGNPLCATMTVANVSCGTGYYMQGFSSSGSAICNVLPGGGSQQPPYQPPVQPPVQPPYQPPVQPPVQPPANQLPKNIFIPNLTCSSGSGGYGFIIQPYLNRGRCADDGTMFWISAYSDRIAAGVPQAQAQLEVVNAINAGLSAETQATRDNMCPDPVRYTFEPYVPTNPSNQCTVRCSYSNVSGCIAR